MKTITRIAVLAAVLVTANSCCKQDDTEAAQLASFGSVALQKGEWQEAYDQLARASTLRPPVAEYHTGAGMAAIKLGRPNVAEKHYDAAAQILAKPTTTTSPSVRRRRKCWMRTRKPAPGTHTPNSSCRSSDPEKSRQS